MAVTKPYTYPGIRQSSSPVPQKPVDIAALAANVSPQAALEALSARAMSPVAATAMRGSTEEAMVDEQEDKSRPAMPGSRRTRRRAQFGVGYNTGVSI